MSLLADTVLELVQILTRQRLVALFATTLAIWGPVEVLDGYLATVLSDVNYFKISFDIAQFLDASVGVVAAGTTITIVNTPSPVQSRVAFLLGIRGGLEAWPRLLWANILASTLIIFGLLLLLIPGIYLMVRLLLVGPITVCEGISGASAIRRSFTLTEGRFYELVPVFIVFIILVVLGYGMILGRELFMPASESLFTRAVANLFADFFNTAAIVVSVATFRALVEESSKEGGPSW